MSLEKKAEQSAVPPQCVPEEKFGSLGGCLVEGDAEQRLRERRIRRRSLGISVGLQSALLAALVIAPLFAKTEIISYNVTPVPPYVHHPESSRRAVEVHPRAPRPACGFCAPRDIPPTIVTHTSPRDDSSLNNPLWTSDPTGPETPGTIAIGDLRSQPQPPETDHNKKDPPKRLRIVSIEQAMLTRRIEPIYPSLARQTGRAGRVELHAIIATDGSVQSLEVVEGDPLFVRSALEAVSQWRYKPTMLNGQAVEVDTHITVIYSMQR
jgi:protein TonB